MTRRIWDGMRLAPMVVAALLACYSGANAANCDALLQEAKNTHHPLPQRDLLASAIQKCATHAGLQYEYGYSLERLRHYEAALDHYQQALALEPGLAKAWFGQGDVSLLLGDYRQAVASYEHGLTLTPDNERGKRSLAAARAGAGPKPGAPPLTAKVPTPESRNQQISPHPPSAGPNTTPATEARVASDLTSTAAESEKNVDSDSHLLETTMIAFQSGSEELTPEAKTQLDTVGKVLTSNQLELVKVEVGGHTDNQGPLPINMTLSRLRAEAVVNYLTRKFEIKADRLIPKAYGPTHPYSTPNNGSNRLNRRVQFKPLPTT